MMNIKHKNRIKYYVGCLCMIVLFGACEDESTGIISYEAIPSTPIGTKLAVGTNLVATIFSDSTYLITDGVEATEIHYFSKKGYSMKIFVFEVDLTNPKLGIEVSTPNNQNEFGLQPMTQQAVFENSNNHKVWGGVNGDFFNTTTGVPNGIVYKNGVMLKSFTGANSNFFALTKENKAFIGDAELLTTLNGTIQEGIGGGVLLVRNNFPIVQTDFSVNPRTCIGTSKDNKTVYILVIDGRNYHYSNGMTYEELGKCMMAFGASDALNLDGGGSSTFFIRAASTELSPFTARNWPCDNGGKERAVANGLLIVSNE